MAGRRKSRCWKHACLVAAMAAGFVLAYMVTRVKHSLAFLEGEGAQRVEIAASRSADADPSQSAVATVLDRRTTAPSGMVWVPGGEFLMGSDDPGANSAERPAHRVRLTGFWMDRTELTNADFHRFVAATGYVTTAERPVDWEQLKTQLPPGTAKPPADAFVPGSLVFSPPSAPVPLDDITRWWKWVPGASWQHPSGSESSVEGRDDYPVVQISWDDAVAYATWAGKRLPTEAEWEFACRGRLEGKRYAWGDEFQSGGVYQANTWQGHFPDTNTKEDGFLSVAPVKSFPPNSYGLYDMIGNVWEWCSDWYRPDTYCLDARISPLVNPTGPAKSYDPDEPYQPKRVTRGGSFLCSLNFCSNYRPSARRGMATDSGTLHLGFRCVLTAETWQKRNDHEPASR
jgi:formylglycine-generating enzyme required for sulfatase activity